MEPDVKPVQQPRSEPRQEKEWREFAEEMLGPVSVMLVILLCWTSRVDPDLRLNKPEGETTLAEELALTPEEVNQVSKPLARVLAKQNINAKVRKRIVESGDYVQLGFFFVGYGTRVMSTLQYVREATGGKPKRAKPVKNAGTVQPTQNGHSPEQLPAFLNDAFTAQLGGQYSAN